MRYPPFDQETAAFINALRRFQHLLRLAPYITLQTDSSPAVDMLTRKKFEDVPFKYQRYRVFLQTFNARIHYVSKKGVVLADMLSRQPYLLKPTSISDLGKIVSDEELSKAVTTSESVPVPVLPLATLNSPVIPTEELAQRIIEQQQRHPAIQLIKAEIKERGTNISLKESEYYLATNGALMRRTADKHTKHEQLEVPDDPPELRLSCLHWAHAGPLSSHGL